MHDWMPPTAGQQIAEIVGVLLAFLGPLFLVFGPMILIAIGARS